MLCPSTKANQNFFFRFPLEKETWTPCWLFSYQNDGRQRKRAGSRIKPSRRRSCFARVSPCSDRVLRALHRWSGPTTTFVGDKPSKTTHGEDTNPAGVPAALGLGEYLEQGGGHGRSCVVVAHGPCVVISRSYVIVCGQPRLGMVLSGHAWSSTVVQGKYGHTR